jgi:short-subunit dehydrogenase
MRDVLYIITGTTRGIGHELKKILLDNNSNIICLNRKKNDLYDYKVDLSNIEEVSAISYHLRRRIAREYTEHSIVFVNNAFSLGPIGRISDARNYEIVNSLTTNILSPLILLKLLTELSNKLYIINITSGAAHSTNKHLGLYSSSKLFVENFLKFVEIEDNNCIETYNFDPGVTKTRMYETLSASKKFENESFSDAIPLKPAFVAGHLYNIISKELISD